MDDRVVLTHDARGPTREEEYHPERRLYDDHRLARVTVTVRENDKGVNLSTPALEVQEGDADGATYFVTLNTRPTATVTVALAGTAGTDLTLSDDSLTFTRDDWNVPQAVTVTAANDDDGVEDTATITHTPSGGDYTGVAASRLPVTVRERTGVVVAPTRLNVVEGDPDGATYRVKLRSAPSGDVTITPARSGSGDVSVDPTRLTFTTGDWDAWQPIKVTAETNLTAVGGAATVSHRAAGGGYDSVIIDSVSVRITDALNIEGGGIVTLPDRLFIEEGLESSYEVWLSDQPSTGETVTVTISGAAGTDVSVDQTTLTFTDSDWNDRQTVTVSTTADADNEDDEVTLTHSATGGGFDGVTNELPVTVLEDDDRGVTVDPTELDIDEGGSDTYTVVLDAEPSDDVVVNLSTGGEGGFTVDDATLAFSTTDWDTEQTVTVRAPQDDHDEVVEEKTGTIRHRAIGGGYEGAQAGEVTVTVTDDDDPEVTVRFERSSYAVDESDDPMTSSVEENEATVKVILDAEPERAVVIPIIATGQDGATSADYAGVPPSLTFGAADTEATFTFTAVHDTLDDDGESVRLGFGAMPSRVSPGTPAEATVSIADDDDPEVTVRFGAASYDVPEGGAVQVKVILNADPERTVVIPVNAAGQGGADAADYAVVPASLTFDAGDTEKEITVSAAQDDVDDDDESVRLTFGALPGRVTEGSTAQAVVRIADDDVPFVEVDFAEATGTVREGYNLAIKVMLDADPERTVTVPLAATEHDGATHHDYSVPASVTFDAGEREASVIFNAIHDGIDEGDERVVLSFGAPLPHRVSAADPGMTDITITDDDGDGSPIVVNFEPPSWQEVSEGEEATITIRLSKAADHDVNVPLRVLHYMGLTEDDYSGVPGSVPILRGETEARFTFVSVEDDLVEYDEVAVIEFHNLPSIMQLGHVYFATIDIKDDDEAAQPATAPCPADSGSRIVLDAAGTISRAGETDSWRVELDPWRTYVIEVLGADGGEDVMGVDSYGGDLTLADPELVAMRVDGEDGRGVTFSHYSRDFGDGRNSIAVVRAMGPTGWHRILVEGNGGTGTYQLKVRVNDVCKGGHYPWFGGPDGYVLDIPADTSTNRILRPHAENVGAKATGGFLGDNRDWYWDDVPDEDWIAADLLRGYAYTFELWTPSDYPTRHRATDLKLMGIHDPDGDLIAGTAVSRTGTHVSTVFRPAVDGRHYVRVGSGQDDRTGDYNLRVTASRLP